MCIYVGYKWIALLKMKEEKQNTSTLREIFSASNGYLSSKRILGAIVLLGCLVMVIIQAAKEGVTDNIKSLFEWLIATSTGLLGITSVTNIWKNKNKEDKIEVE